MKVQIRIKKTRDTSLHALLQRWFFVATALLSSIVVFAAAWFVTLDFQAQAASPTPSSSPKASVKATTEPVAQVSPTPSPSPSASPEDEQATENLKDRIDRVLEQRQEKLQELEDSGVRRRIFVGDVQRIIDQTVTLRTRRGNQSFAITPDLGLVRDGKKATLDDIVVGDWIAVIGYLDKETVQPQRVFVYASPLRPTEYDTVIGTITDITRTQITITDSSETAHKYTLARTTGYENAEGGEAKREDFKQDGKVVILSKPATSQASAILVRSLAGQ
jgi:hypothetical protein